MNKYTVCSSLSLLISLSSFDAHAIDPKLPIETEDEALAVKSLLGLSENKKRRPEQGDKASEPPRKRKKIDNKQEKSVPENRFSSIDSNVHSDSLPDYANFYKAVMENPDNFQRESDQYKTLLQYLFDGYVNVDLKALGLSPNISEVDFSKDALSDFDKNCLWYLIGHEIDQVRSILPQLKTNTNDESSLHILGIYYATSTEGIHDDEYKKEVLSYIQTMEKRANKSPHLLNTLSHLYQDGGVAEKDEKKSFDYMEQAAKTGLPKMQSNLAIKYYEGHGVTQDYVKALEWLKRAADQGYYPALINLGVMYENGQGVSQDYAKAIEFYQKAADQGSADAYKYIGLMYEKGQGASQDYAKAIEFYQKAADQGSVEGQSALGYLYRSGHGVPQDYAKAIEFYQKAADQGSVEGQNALGDLYRSGQGVPQDYAKAIEFYQKAADQGSVKAQTILGCLYEKGQGVPQDYAKAIEFYQKAADQGSAKAQTILGCLYEKGQGVSQDSAKAVEFYQKAAERGFAQAQYILGCLYENGCFVSRDSVKAVELYKKAADQGLAEAQSKLAFMYKNGWGVLKDSAKAFELYQKAAGQGFANSQFNLALMYFKGLGVSQDHSKMVEWLEKAVQQKHAGAEEFLALLYCTGKVVQKDHTKALELFEKAANHGGASAYEYLYKIYSTPGHFQGFPGHFQNLEKARYWKLRGMKTEQRFSTDRQEIRGLSITVKNKDDAEEVKKTLETDISKFIGIFGFFEGMSHFCEASSRNQGSQDVNEDNDLEAKRDADNLKMQHMNFDLSQGLFNDINDQLTTMKQILECYASPDFMNPYVNTFSGPNSTSLDFDTTRSEKWLDMYRYKNARFYSLGKKENDLSTSFMQILNDKATEKYFGFAWPSMKEMVKELLRDQGLENVNAVNLYSDVKKRFIDFIFATSDLRNPRFK